MSKVYLIHFDTPLKHASHYIGWASQYKRRIAHHQNGNGARILQVCNERGIKYNVVRTWEDGDKALERRLKRQKNAARLCPVCNPDHWQNHEHNKNGGIK